MTSALKHPVYYRAHIALHTLWTKCACHHNDYDKKEWKELDAAIYALWQLAKYGSALVGEDPI